jgi:hypothetical protein
MDCPKCGKDFGFLGNQFWCRKCKAYYCDSCAREKLVCPKCGGPISVDKTSIFPISLSIMAIIMVSISLFVSSFSYSYDYSEIGDLRPRDYVRIYGVINSSSPVVASIDWINDSWQLQNYTLFEISEPGNSSLSISINISQCKHFNLDEAPSSGCNTYEYRAGRPVTVKGWVTTGESGNLSINVISIYPGKISPESGSYLPFIFGGAGLMLLAALVAGFQMHRRSLHRIYLEQNPVLKMPDKAPVEKRPESRTDWTDNPLFQKYHRWSGPLKYFAIFVGVPMFIASLIVFFTGYMPIIVLMILALFLIVFSGLQSLIDSNTPTRVAIAEDGLHMQYAKPRGPDGAKTFIAWDDIKFIYSRTEEKAEGIQMELKDGMTTFRASTEILDAILAAYKAHRGAQSRIGRSEEIIGNTPVTRPASGSFPSIHIRPNETLQNRLPGWMTATGFTVISTGVLAVGAFTYINRNNFNLDFWENLGIISMMFFMIGLMLVGLGYNALGEVMFSDGGIAFRFRGSKKEPITIPWNSISRVSPVGMGWFYIELAIGENIRLMHIEQRIAEGIAKEIDKHYIENHPESRADIHNGPITEKLENIIKKRIGRFLTGMICVLSIGIVILGLSIYPIFFNRGSNSMFGLAGTYLSMPFIAFPIVLFSKKFPLWRNAPYGIDFNQNGFVPDHHGRQPPAGHAGAIGWNEISRIESLPEAVKNLQLTWDLRDTDTSRTIVIRKRSGTAHILGPVDPAIADAVKERMARLS